jgi:hypothetical protein
VTSLKFTKDNHVTRNILRFISELGFLTKHQLFKKVTQLWSTSQLREMGLDWTTNTVITLCSYMLTCKYKDQISIRECFQLLQAWLIHALENLRSVLSFFYWHNLLSATVVLYVRSHYVNNPSDAVYFVCTVRMTNERVSGHPWLILGSISLIYASIFTLLATSGSMFVTRNT